MFRICFRFAVCLTALLALVVGPTAGGRALAQDDGPVTVTDAYGSPVVIEDTSRIITIGGAVTETVFALGYGDSVVAVDESSIYPEAVFDLPLVGYLRFLAVEPILELEPTLIITTVDAGPAEVLDQIRASGITLLVVPAEDSVAGGIETIRTIAAALSAEEAGAEIIAHIETSVAAAEALVATAETTPRVLFLFLRGDAVQGISGSGTGADEMIRLAGAENAITAFEGYQPISAEVVIAAAPDVILTTSNGIESIGGLDALLALPGISETPAAQNGRVVASLDDLYLLGFTPRVGDAIVDLTYLLHDELPRPLFIVARLSGEFDVLLQAVAIANYGERLTSEGPFTVFAPNQAAFDALPEGLLDSLFTSPISVQAVTGYHILTDEYTLEELAALDGQIVPTLFGPPLLIGLDEDGSVVINNVARIVTPDIRASNGIIHVIDTVLIPERPRR